MTQDDKGVGGGLEHPKKRRRNLWTAPRNRWEIGEIGSNKGKIGNGNIRGKQKEIKI